MPPNMGPITIKSVRTKAKGMWSSCPYQLLWQRVDVPFEVGND